MLIAGIFFLGLVIGSFLNVIIVRLPKMLENSWKKECTLFLNLSPDINADNASTAFDLAVPRSHCPNCQTPIAAYDNIPLISYLFLKGKCRHCKTSISAIYPIVEGLTAGLSGLAAYAFGPSIELIAALILIYSFICASFIDFKHYMLPDEITLPVLWIGLFVNAYYKLFVTCECAIFGAIAGYLSLWSICYIFKKLTHKEGMGEGDFKLLALLGAWFGWQSLPTIILISSFAGSIIGLVLILFYKHNKDNPIPFGPYLALAGLIYLFIGKDLNTIFLQNMVIHS